MKHYKLYYLILFFSIIYSYNDFNQNFGTMNLDDIILESPFLGGFNKPKIQWFDWDNDNDEDLFLLDEDGCIKVYENIASNQVYNFLLVESCFQNINNISWFYFADYDNDLDFDLITQDSINLDMLIYYENILGDYTSIANIKNDLGENIVIQSVMTPTFADIDNDGDLDFFVGNVVGTISYYENIGLEDGIPIYSFITNYWEEIYIVGASQLRHGASAISFIDLDNDEDLDLTWGDYYQQSLYVIYNLGDSINPDMDNINIVTQYPYQDPIVSAGLNMPSFADIDQDGDNDLFVTVLSGAYGYQLINNFYYYENVVIDGLSEFQFVTNNFLQTFDELSDVNPEFFDYDSDDDMDLVIGTDFDPSSFPWVGKLMLFENIGYDDNNEPIWSLVDNQFLGNEMGNNLSPSAVDIDYDGDLDLFVGNFNGTLQYFENIGSSSSYEYQFIEYVADIDLSGYSSPEFIDIDNDNDYDLILGDMNGAIHLYLNIGDKYNYNFQFISNDYQNIDVSFRSSPLAFDYDSDGDMDLYIGSGNNNLYLYEMENNIFVLNEEESIFNLGKNISPSIFSDSYSKGLVVGLSTGGMYFLPFCNYDFNNDNQINIIDAVLMIVYIFGTFDNDLDEKCLDLNSDLTIDVLDVIAIIDYILNM